MATTSVDGLISGLSTTDTIAQLMAVEKQSQTRLTQKKTTNDSLVSTYQSLNSRMLALKDMATALTLSSGWQASRAVSSDSTIVSTTASSTAQAGALTFRVDRLATAHGLVSSGSVASTSAVVATPNSHFLVAATGALGFSQATGSNDLALGAHTVEVTQASSGAVQRGAALGTTITILPHTTVEVASDGSTTTTQSLDLAGGTYTRTELADLITTASGGSLKASFTNDGKLELRSTREGSAAKLAITGGTALTDLGLAVSTAAASGTDAIVKVDGVSTTITDVNAGSALTLPSTTGSLSVTLGGGIRVGKATVNNVDFGDGTLASVTSAINAASGSVRAAAVQVSPGNFRLQLTSTATGQAGRITSDTSAFNASFGGMTTLTAPEDAKLTVGSGPAAYNVTSSDNKIELLPGVTVSLLKAAPATDVTVTVSSDADAIAGKIGSLVDSVNSALNFITAQSKYDASTKKGGPLLSDAMARSLQRQLYDAVSSLGGSASTYGITLAKDATLSFDRAKFTAAYQANPTATQAAFMNETTGLATKMVALGKAATDSETGQISSAILGKQSLSKNLADQISNWDTRLSLRESALRKTFSDLEVSLGKMKNQSSWLSSQLNSLSRA